MIEQALVGLALSRRAFMDGQERKAKGPRAGEGGRVGGDLRMGADSLCTDDQDTAGTMRAKSTEQ
ncbi:hypothetical protein M514_04245 [Trichuris suis]|uniref:Uncharacterized protein n=1 Tax=Trichuris suis TaxID=68888 RepID=A0A085MC65_9BILA|nr:hypothetical protein M513_04245 [Trichuris suis]KFD71685.1 hypothetical protein M514_04245 [Trichuris suis]